MSKSSQEGRHFVSSFNSAAAELSPGAHNLVSLMWLRKKTKARYNALIVLLY